MSIYAEYLGSVMRRFLVAVAFLGSSLVAYIPDALAECKGDWCKGACYPDGCEYVKLINRGYPIRRVLKRGEYDTIRDYDCEEYKMRFADGDAIGDPNGDLWFDLPPGVVGHTTLKVVCSM